MSSTKELTAPEIKQKPKTTSPKKYQVVLLNDDYTPMDFVVRILESIFYLSPSEATTVMLAVHKKGRGVAGIYNKQVAESKCHIVTEIAKKAGYPLQAISEEI